MHSVHRLCTQQPPLQAASKHLQALAFLRTVQHRHAPAQRGMKAHHACTCHLTPQKPSHSRCCALQLHLVHHAHIAYRDNHMLSGCCCGGAAACGLVIRTPVVADMAITVPTAGQREGTCIQIKGFLPGSKLHLIAR